MRAMRRALLEWYDQHRRPLPWRSTRDPYRIWVSEIMCQQTRVDTVIPYYARFVERFPTLADLARASENDVLAQWSGLGYYRRARMLHRGVREVVAQYGGVVPRDAAERRSLPGIGRYTAGAIGSIAFDAEEPIVDGNVARVLSRVFRIETPLGRAVTERALWEHAAQLVKGPRPGDLNQGLMELGATVCVPHSPSCERCPWEEHCAAHAMGLERELPRPRAKTKPKEVHWVAVLATRGHGAKLECFLQQPADPDGLFAGLWLPPMRSIEPVSTKKADLDVSGREARKCLREHGLTGRLVSSLPSSSSSAEPMGTVTHVLSHRRFTITVWRVTGAVAQSTSRAVAHRVAELDKLGVPRLTRKMLELIE